MTAQLTPAGTLKPLEPELQPEKPLKGYFLKNRDKDVPNTSSKLYMQYLLNAPGHKKLIEIEGTQDVEGFRYHLQQYCKSTSRPFFCINSPKDLVCSAPFTLREGATGTLKNGPGGPLYDFLIQHSKAGTKPVIIVDYRQFSASDIVRFNALLDKIRLADGTPLPVDAQVIGLMDPTQPDAYDGSDFLSRFDAISKNPLSAALLRIPPLAEAQHPLTEVSQSINLYGGEDWEERLLGHWVLKGQTLHFVEGELILALKENKTHLELKNAPWDNPAFVAFWQEALVRKSMTIQGKKYVLPPRFTLSRAEGYSFEKTKSLIKVNESEGIPENARALNRTVLTQFLAYYQYDAQGKTIQYQEGILAQNKEKTLNLYVDEEMDLASWGLLLDACETYKVSLELSFAPGVMPPEELNLQVKPRAQTPKKSWEAGALPKTACIQSTDTDVTLSQLPPDALILDVSEVSSADLLMQLDGSFNEKTLAFHFSEYEGALLKALKEDKTVVLKGTMNDKLRYALTDLLLQRRNEVSPKGHLILISDQEHVFPMLPHFVHEVTPAEKRTLIADKFSEAFCAQHSLAALQAMARQGDKAWQGLEMLPPQAPASSTIDLEGAEKEAADFNQGRLDEVEALLKQTPFVFLAGMTGVGKTSFIHEVWKKKHAALHIGEASKLAWAKDTSKGKKILFIDEANISSKHWSEFEGLFAKPPRILIGHEVVELTEEHQVIFAGNPASYGGERHMPSLFARHGNCVVFNPLTPAYLYQYLLKPIFDKAGLNAQTLALPLLEMAKYLNALNPKEVLITPRELTMMALMTVSYCKKHPEAKPREAARYYAYTLAKPFVPSTHQEAFDADFEKPKRLLRTPLKPSDDLLITPSNQHALDALCDFMELRALRQAQEIQAEGGLGGLILEGAPGLGKTELVVNTLLALGLHKGNLTEEHPHQPVFYVIPVSMSYEEKVKVLLKAFHEGAPVVIDEINSAPMMETLLNDLLMGKDPKGEPAKTPGFLVIGTQNPATLAGRIQASTALEHRMHKVVIQDYPKPEMLKILAHKGLPKDLRQDMVQEYLYLRESPSSTLCFRDVIESAEREKTAINTCLEREFTKKLELLAQKQKESEATYHEALITLHAELQKAGKRYFDNPTREHYEIFKFSCTKHINACMALLKNNKELKSLVLNLRAFVFSAASNEEIDHRFRFYSKEEQIPHSSLGGAERNPGIRGH